ncbi:MAG: leucine-rich repeat domain-containing protein, partial [Acidobacteriota bacterium]
MWAQSDDRATAEWALRFGGRVRMADSAWLTAAEKLPAGALRLEGVDLAGTIVDHRDLKLLTGCTELRELILPGTIFNPGAGSTLDANKELAALKTLTKLERFGLSLHFLEHINVQDKGLKEFANLTQIREMRVAMANIRGAGLEPFVNLERLDLNNTRMNDEGMKQIAGMKKLRYLSLRDTFVTDEGLQQLAGLQELETLDLFGLRLTERGMCALPLRKLDIVSNDLGDEELVHIGKMTTLEELYLSYCRHTNKGLAELKGLTNRRVFDSVRSRLD